MCCLWLWIEKIKIKRTKLYAFTGRSSENQRASLMHFLGSRAGGCLVQQAVLHTVMCIALKHASYIACILKQVSGESERVVTEARN